MRWRTHGDTSVTRKKPNGTYSRYLKEVAFEYRGADCLIWPFSRATDGYSPFMAFNGERARAHILVCTHRNGPRPSKTYDAAHSCGNGHLGCISPGHLSWKTRSENHQDKRAHGTYQLGELNPDAKLNEAQVREIRALKGAMTHREIAAIYGVSRENIGAIQRRESWAHI